LIDSRAIIDDRARIGSNVEIGPYSVIGPDVEIDDGNRIAAHVVIRGPARIGRDNHIYQFCSIGDDPQDKKYAGEADSRLEIGNGNTIREFCSINRGTASGGGVTRLGDDNWIMAYVHIAHDCIIGNHTVFANNATLAGHVSVEDYAILGGFTGVHQFCRIGAYSFSAIASVIVKDVPPFIMVSGNTAGPNSLNREGLRRHGFSSDSINALRKAYKTVYRDGLLLKDALDQLQPACAESEEVVRFVEFIRESSRGIVR
jgi:UDP-N-acetylglucosamine acyltransferase